jgi:hypothetical protein
MRGTITRARAHTIPFVNDIRLRAEAWHVGHLTHCASWFARDRFGRRAYRILDEQALRATRRSETVFVFGSGKSLLDLTDDDWDQIAEHDTFGFNQFHKQRWVRVDYHLIAEAIDAEEYATSIRENPYYGDTVFCVQAGLLAHRGNEIVGSRLLPERGRIFRFRRRSVGRYAPPSRSFSRGVVHYANTSLNAANFAVLAGWKRVVLVGVDLYDKEYFFLPQGGLNPYDRRGPASSTFPNAARVVDAFGRWRPVFESMGVELLVFNPRSLLAEVLDVFSWDRSGSVGDVAEAR